MTRQKVINILKAQYGLRDKSEAINKLAKESGKSSSNQSSGRSNICKLLEVQKEPIIKLGAPPIWRRDTE